MAAVEVPQTLEYRGGQLNAAPVLEVENFTNWKKRFMCHIIGIEPQFENIIKNGPFIPMTAGQRKPENQWTGDERKAANLDQRLKSLIINKNNVKDSELASLFGKLKYEENLIDSIYETKKNKSLVSTTPLSTTFFSFSIVQDFQDSPDDEEDTRSSHEYLNDLEEEYQARALLDKSKRFFKKGTQRFSSAKATNQTECYKCGKKGNFARDCWPKTYVSTYQTPFQPKPLSFPQDKPELRPTKYFEAKYNKVKAKLALLKEVSSDDNEMVEVKVLMALAEENDVVSKEGARNGKWVKMSMRKGKKDLVFVKSSTDDTKVTIHGVERPWLSEAEGFILPNHDTGRILPVESQRNTTDPSVAIADSVYDLADESSVCSTLLPPLKKLNGVEPISRPKTIKSILRSKSTFKTEALKGVIINEPSTPAKGNKSSSSSKVHSAPVGKLKSVKSEDDPPLAIVMKELYNMKLQVSRIQSSYSRSNQSQQCDIRKPIWYLDSGCSRHMTGVKSYLHKYVEQSRPKVVFGDDSTCTTEGYGSIK
ncbi:retrovirus-related pol polyprotein from transposon TNT 1-94, partial [Tanacetum coccineum]